MKKISFILLLFIIINLIQSRKQTSHQQVYSSIDSLLNKMLKITTSQHSDRKFKSLVDKLRNRANVIEFCKRSIQSFKGVVEQIIHHFVKVMFQRKRPFNRKQLKMKLFYYVQDLILNQESSNYGISQLQKVDDNNRQFGQNIEECQFELDSYLNDQIIASIQKYIKQHKQ